MTHFDEKMSGFWPDNHKQGIEFSRFSRTFYHKQGQGFKVRAVPSYPNLGRVPPPGGIWCVSDVSSVSPSSNTAYSSTQKTVRFSKLVFQCLSVTTERWRCQCVKAEGWSSRKGWSFEVEKYFMTVLFFSKYDNNSMKGKTLYAKSRALNNQSEHAKYIWYTSGFYQKGSAARRCGLYWRLRVLLISLLREFSEGKVKRNI